MFHGSYDPDDVTFLLKPVRLAFTEVAEKERLIQSGRRHYSEMLSRESLPSPRYLQVFHAALALEEDRFARDVLALARHLAAARQGEIVIASLARAGTPVGVLLTRALRSLLGRQATHYSLSIIRDRGIDEAALNHILARHPAASVAFVDGWTGKGVIAAELRRAVTAFNARQGTALDPGLYAVADLAGAAAWAASTDDYLIPSSVLGATVSGLVSRSVLNADAVGPGDFHACVHYNEFEPHDLSRWFADRMTAAMQRHADAPPPPAPGPADLAAARRRRDAFLDEARRRFGVRDTNHVKPGLGEATRVLLRRVPDLLLLREADAPQAAHLRLLAGEKGVRTVVDPTLPYAAAAVIKELEG